MSSRAFFYEVGNSFKDCRARGVHHPACRFVEIGRILGCGLVEPAPTEFLGNVAISIVGESCSDGAVRAVVDRRDFVCHSACLHVVVEKRIVLVGDSHGKIKRTFPSFVDVGRDDVERHYFCRGQRVVVFACRIDVFCRIDCQMIGNGKFVACGYHSVFHQLGRIKRNIHVRIVEIRIFFSVVFRKVDFRIVVVGNCVFYGFRRRRMFEVMAEDAKQPSVVGECSVVGLHRERSRFVSGTAHLGHVPIGGKIGEIDNSHVGAPAFHFLRIPQRECVVVTAGKYDSVFVNACQVVHAEVAASIAAGAVVVVPCLADHLERNEYAQCHSDCGCRLFERV